SSLYADYMMGIIILSFMNASIASVIVATLMAIISFDSLIPAIQGVSGDYWFPVLILMCTFIFYVILYMRKYSLGFVERKIPEFKDMLVTIHDYRYTNNTVVEQLHHDTLQKAKQLS